MIRVLLADDEALIRSGLAVLLRHEPGFEVVGSAADGLSAVRLAHEQRPDVVLMDVRMPGIDGIEATRRLVADPATASVRVLILTTFDHDANVFAALHAGAVGQQALELDDVGMGGEEGLGLGDVGDLDGGHG